MKLLRPTIAIAVAICAATSLVAYAAPSRLHVRHGATSPTLSPRVARPSHGHYRVAGNHLLVTFKGGKTARKLARVFESANTSAGAVSVVSDGVLAWRIPPSTDASGFAAALTRTGLIANVVPDYVRPLAGYVPPSYTAPNDPAYLDTYTWGYPNGLAWYEQYPNGKSWWIRNINAVSSWQQAYTGSNILGKYPLRASGTAIKVAVLDTGFYADHPDVGANIVRGSADATPVDPSAVGTGTIDDETAEVSHGTCVAGEIGATVANGVGTLGTARDTQVAVYKVYFGGDGIADSVLIKNIRQAADDGCKVISMSIAGGPYNQLLQDAVNYAWNKGSVIVAASGNDSVGTVSYPAAMTNVVAVGALGLGPNGTSPIRSDFSNYGTNLDISAPGEFVWGLTKPDYISPTQGDGTAGYMWWDGTSMATPIVSGSIAWLWRLAPSLSNADIVALVENSATDLGAVGRDNTFGHGNLNMAQAYASLRSTYPLLSKPAITVVSQSNVRAVQLSWTAVAGYKVTYDVAVDSTTVTGGLTATSYTLPSDTTTGAHVVTVTPRSSRNWADGTEVASATVSPSVSIPLVTSLRYYRGNLRWSDTEAGLPHTYQLIVDGQLRSASGTSWSTAGLSKGSHAATLTVTDNASVASAPKPLTFIVRPSPTVSRFTGANRYGYAASVSRNTFPSAGNVVIASGASWPDALAAAPLAHQVAGPVLLSGKTSVPAETLTELSRLKAKKIILIGGTGFLADSVRASLVARHYSVSRISGSDHYAIAAAIARSVATRAGGTPRGARAVITGFTYTDALPASAVAARKGWPRSCRAAASVPLSARSALTAAHVTSTLVVGNTLSVSDAAKNQLPSATRIGATTPLGVAPALANWATSHYPADFSNGGERIDLASSSAWANGLGLGSDAARLGWLVIVTPYSLATEARSYYSAHSEIAVSTRVIGSNSTVSDAAVNTVKGIVGAP